MKTTNFPLRMLATVVLGTSLMTGFTLSASAAPDTPPQANQDWTKHRQEEIQRHLAKTADRLEIKSSQQSAWQVYAKAVEAAENLPRPAFDPNADAATITRNHAELAAAHARSLAQIADATAKLQAVLTPEQRKTLDQIVRFFPQPGHHDQAHHEHDDNRQDHHDGEQPGQPAGH